MKPIPIQLGISRSARGAQANSGTTEKELPADIKQKVFDRDDNTCRCCGFKSKKYQEVLHINGVEGDHDPQNLATVCIFCHQCFNLDRVTVMRSGVLVWLPEVSQKQLHHVARATYVARISQGPVSEAARRSLDILMERRAEVRNRLGTDDPFILSTVLKDYISDKAYTASRKKLDGVRLFPLDRRIIKQAELEFNQFPQILAYWRSKDGPFGGKIPKQWVDIYRDIGAVKSA